MICNITMAKIIIMSSSQRTIPLREALMFKASEVAQVVMGVARKAWEAKAYIQEIILILIL